MFSFNFGSDRAETGSSSEEECESATKIDPSECEKFTFVDNNNSVSLNNTLKINTLSKNNLIALLANNNDSSIQKAESSHSDLLPGEYEGGLKIWECTYDLSDYILKHDAKSTFEGKAILDLGCGAGILGILAKILGAKSVDFQDYNIGVIKNLTIPNVILNFPTLDEFEFWYGDWSGFRKSSKYDVILTSETIYNVQNYSKLHKLFKENLKPDGIIYLASKSYYFGVGGSVNEFCDFLEKKGIFTFQKVFQIEEGVKRDILEIHFKEDHRKDS